MIITNQITPYEISTIIIAATSALFALSQWRKSVALKRAEFAKEALSTIRDDAEIASVLYELDYGESIWYDEMFISNHELDLIHSHIIVPMAESSLEDALKEKRQFLNI